MQSFLIGGIVVVVCWERERESWQIVSCELADCFLYKNTKKLKSNHHISTCGGEIGLFAFPLSFLQLC
jgi:hypothetical protein